MVTISYPSFAGLDATEIGYLDGVTPGTAIASKAVVLDSGGDFILLDNHVWNFGTGSDVQIRWDATDFDILAAADDSVIKLGNGTNSFDLWVYGNTASDYVLWDASAGKMTFEGAAYVDLSGGHRYSISSITGNTSPGADDSGKVYVITGGTGVTFTLPAVATSTGVHYKVFNAVDQNMVIDGPANTLVLFNDVTATSLTFSQAGEKVGNAVQAFCDGSFWYVMVHLSAEAVTSIVA